MQHHINEKDDMCQGQLHVLHAILRWSCSKVARLSLKVKNTRYVIELSVKSPCLHTIFGPAFTPYHQNPVKLYL